MKTTVIGVIVAGLLLTGCSSQSPDEAVSSSNNPSPSASFSEFPTEPSSTALAVATEVIGMTEEDAIQTIEGISSEQLTARVVRRDDESYAVTKDYSHSRINLEIDNGIVTKTSIG
jgi:PBP1b-binding outer membrane lipoprotein LpoB